MRAAASMVDELIDRMSRPTLPLLALGRAVFGYHEVFHALATMAAGRPFAAAVASIVLPTA